MKIYLYTAIPRAKENVSRAHSYPRSLQRAVKGTVAGLAWRLGLQPRFHYSTHETVAGSNVGDQAIRLASVDALTALGADVVEVGWGDLTDDLVAHINAQASAFIVSAGAYLHFSQTGALAPRLHEDLRFFGRLSCPLISYGIGLSHKVGPGDPPTEEVSSEAQALLHRFVARLDLCSVRDHRSRRILESAGVHKPIHVIPDPALFLTPLNCVSQSPAHIRAIGLNFAFHGSHTANLLQKYGRTYASVAQRLLRDLPDSKLYYMVHSSSEMFVCNLLRRAGLPFTTVVAAPRELLGYYSSLDLHIGQMMHSCVLALNRHIAVVSLEYDTKCRELLKMFTLEDFCISPNDYTVETIVDVAHRALDNRTQVRTTITKALDRLREEYDHFLALTRELVRFSSPRGAAHCHPEPGTSL
jgi:hypothetical protein